MNKKNKLLEELITEFNSADKLQSLSREIESFKSEKIEIQLLERENREKILYLSKEKERILSEINTTKEKLANNKNILEEAGSNIGLKTSSNEENKNSLEDLKISISNLDNSLRDFKEKLDKKIKIF
ncbi:hypothetical protein [Peptoniphilus timonensis]|uniref:hypothetical protein n=1 Tax=Peptoniphilus timonensis TaxID=1268254 RepID=UPI0002E09C4E|nr:hypothetical protein [Peptoniphilus timonensis]